MSSMKELDDKNGPKERLTKRNRKFIELLLKDVNVVDAHRLAGYSGARESAYQLKQKLKPFLSKAYEIEGLSTEGYRTRLLRLLSLPCLDSKGNPISSLSYNQYLEALRLLRDELPSNKVATPNITAFVIQRYGGKNDAKEDTIDITPISGRPGKSVA